MPKSLQYYINESKRCLRALEVSIPNFQEYLQRLVNKKTSATRLEYIKILTVQHNCIDAWVQRATDVCEHLSEEDYSRKLSCLCAKWLEASPSFVRSKEYFLREDGKIAAVTTLFMRSAATVQRRKKRQKSSRPVVVSGCGCFPWRRGRLRKAGSQKSISAATNLSPGVGASFR